MLMEVITHAMTGALEELKGCGEGFTSPISIS